MMVYYLESFALLLQKTIVSALHNLALRQESVMPRTAP